jgi:hypothetical protein
MRDERVKVEELHRAEKKKPHRQQSDNSSSKESAKQTQGIAERITLWKDVQSETEAVPFKPKIALRRREDRESFRLQKIEFTNDVPRAAKDRANNPRAANPKTRYHEFESWSSIISVT